MPFSARISLFFLLFVSFIACRAPESKKPVLIVEKDTFDFGTISQGDSARASFSFRNEGTGLLIIKKLGVSCGCTNAVSSKDSLYISESANIFASYHSGKDSGQILKTIVVESNTTPVLHILFIKGRVNPINQGQIHRGS